MLKYLRLATVVLATLAAPLTWAGKPPTNKPPAVNITSPVTGSTFTAPAAVTISATATDSDGTISKVDFYQGTTLLGTKTSAPYTITWSNVLGGTYSLTAKATDNAGATTTSAAVSVTVTGSKITIASPINGATVYGGSVNVSGAFSGDSTTRVWVSNGMQSRLANLSGSNFSTALPVYAGTNTINISVVRLDKTFDSATITVNGADYPQIAVTAPAATTFNAPASVTFAVDAVSPAGSISKVNFFSGSTLLGSAAAAPYQTTWANIPKGSYTVTAQAIDSLGYSSSAYIPITVLGPNSPPTVSLTSPSNNAAYGAPASIPFAASASDSDGTIAQVEFLQGGTLLGTTNVAPYKFDWNNVAVGSYTLTARATDNSGATTTSAPVTVSVANGPSVSFSTSAAGGTVGAGSSVLLSAVPAAGSNPISQVEFYQGSTLLGVAKASPYTYSWNNVALGTYSLTAKAIDTLGIATTSAPVTVTVVSAPAVTMTSPAPGAKFYVAADVTITATATEDGHSISKVEFYEGANLLGTVTSAPYTYTWKKPAAGAYSLTAVATDDRSVSGTSSAVNVTIAAPGISIASPTDGATVAPGRVLVRGTVDAPAYSGVAVNGIVAIVDGNGNFYANDVPLSAGPNTLTAMVTTVDEATGTSSITVSTGAAVPTQVMMSSTEGIGSLDTTMTVESSNLIQRVDFDFYGDGQYVYTYGDSAFATPTSKFVLNLTYPAAGVFQPIVTVTDRQGTVSVHRFAFEVHDPVIFDGMFNSLWNRMTGKLKNGDIDSALTSVSGAMRARFKTIFTALSSNLAVITDKLGALANGTFSVSMAEYFVIRQSAGDAQAFPLHFMRGGDGVWRIEGM